MFLIHNSFLLTALGVYLCLDFFHVYICSFQFVQEISDETDLTYYDRNRLESEFRKLKELKHKADQYAVEAKQTAQRLSAENFKLKEDLSRERHFNELERKNMLREMETQMGRKGGEEEREEAKKEVVAQAIFQRATELAATMRGPLEMSRGIYMCTVVRVYCT